MIYCFGNFYCILYIHYLSNMILLEYILTNNYINNYLISYHLYLSHIILNKVQKFYLFILTDEDHSIV